MGGVCARRLVDKMNKKGDGPRWFSVWPQVVLSFQLSFAVFPLVMFTSDPMMMGRDLVNGPVTKAVGWGAAWFIALLNVVLLVQTFAGMP
jgi:manganese transport protein